MTRMLQLIPSAATLVPTRNVMNWLFDDIGMPPLIEDERTWAPAFDIAETDKEYVLSAEMPGIDEKDVEVTVSEGILTVKGEKKKEHEEKTANYHRIERSYGSFCRNFLLPEEVETDKVEATYRNGILKLTLPKGKEREVKRIAISSN